RGDVVRMVLHETLVLVAAGIVIGIPAALLLSRLTASLLYGIRPADPASIVAAIAIMLASAIAAAYFPARRASRIDPMQALRCELSAYPTQRRSRPLRAISASPHSTPGPTSIKAAPLRQPTSTCPALRIKRISSATS